jgi:hypothetical protein
MRASEPFPLQPTSGLLERLAEKVDRQRRLRAALAENDRYSLAIHWLLHDYYLTFATFKVSVTALRCAACPGAPTAHRRCPASLTDRGADPIAAGAAGCLERSADGMLQLRAAWLLNSRSVLLSLRCSVCVRSPRDRRV